MMDSELVWARDPANGYIQGHITEIGAHEFEVQPLTSKQKQTYPQSDIFQSCEGASDQDDNCKLIRINLTDFDQSHLVDSNILSFYLNYGEKVNSISYLNRNKQMEYKNNESK